MSSFSYRARDKEGLAIDGVVEADTEMIVLQNLSRLGYSVVSIERQTAGLKEFFKNFQKLRKVSKQDIIFFARQLSALLKSGLPITTALSSIVQQLKNETMKTAVEEVIEDIEGGVALSDALGKHPKIFNELLVSMVQVGEAAGILDQVLDRVVVLNTQELDTQMRIRSALIYPIILVSAAIAIVSFLLIAIIPKFVAVFETYDAQLPLATEILLKVSSFFQNFWVIVFIALVALAFWIGRLIRTEKGKYKFHAMLLKFPIFGEFYLKIIVARFARVLGILVKSGVPILNALSVTERTINNVVISKIISNISLAVTEGQSLAEPFKASGIFPSMVIQMISAGEKSGRVDQMLEELSYYYEQETQYVIKNATTIIEPALLLTMGGLVAFIALSVLLPIFNLIKVFRAG